MQLLCACKQTAILYANGAAAVISACKHQHLEAAQLHTTWPRLAAHAPDANAASSSRCRCSSLLLLLAPLLLKAAQHLDDTNLVGNIKSIIVWGEPHIRLLLPIWPGAASGSKGQSVTSCYIIHPATLHTLYTSSSIKQQPTIIVVAPPGPACRT
jgi:hypothetical protein